MKNFKALLLLPFKLLAILLGKFSWTAPGWLKGIHGYSQNNRKQFWGLWILVLACGAGYMYYDSLPKPTTVKASINELSQTENHENAKPGNIRIEFKYDYSKLKKNQKRPSGYPSVARIDLVGEKIKSGITLSPEKKGIWKWEDDRRIEFVPETDWPAGTEYSVTFDKSIFVSEAKLSDDTYEFDTPNFTADISSIEFFQDPQDITVRRVVSTIKFSHPVDKADLEQKLSMTMRPSGSKINVDPKSYTFSVTYDKNLREAYIQSEPVSLPNEPNYMKVTVEKKLKTILGGEPSEESVENKVLIPDIYSFLKVSTAKTEIVRNEKNEPEQLVMLEFTDDIDEKELSGKLSVYLLPKKGELNGKSYWKSPREVSDTVLAASQTIEINLLPNERNYSKFYGFKIDVPEDRYVYIKINKGLTSVNEFIHSSFYDTVIKAPNYPKEVDIAGEGSVLTYSGEHKLGILTRGVPGIKYSIGRLLEGQLYHLITQSNGDITNPRFSSWNFNEENISEFSRKIVELNAGHPKQANYTSIDLSRHLPKDTDRFGLFFVKVSGWDNKRQRQIYGAEDKRLILVTDLGMIVKNNADHTHDIFVQSIQTGAPVAGAKVELLGKNGITLFSKTTGIDGHVSFAETNDFTNEQAPSVYVVKTSKDISFIPYDRKSRQINLSRFDIGGVTPSRNHKDALNAYMFTDRGIYRPDEEINVGVIVKNFDFSNIEGIPLEVVVRGPRHNEVKVEKTTLATKGFMDFQYKTDHTSDTGRYKASLHLVRDNKRRGREIGTVEFKVEEFQPDTMKIKSELIDVADKGWNNKEKIKVQVELKNLFGIPAQDRNMKGRVIIKPTNFSFKDYGEFKFTDPFYDKDRKPLSLNEYLEMQKTDADGMAIFQINLQKFREGTYSLQFIAEGFDQAGGRSVISSNTALISPLNHLVGYKSDGKLGYINANSKRTINFISIDTQLAQLEKSGLIFKKKEIQSVSTLVKQKNGTYKYQTVKKEEELESSDYTIPSAGSEYAVDTATPGDFAIELYDAEERRLARVEYSVVGHGNLSGKIDKNAELQLKLNKEDYYPSESIEMSIRAPYSGAGLISIETDKVLAYKWFKTSSESTVQTISVPQNLEGTGYVNVAFVRDVGSKEIFTSPLSYAVKPFSIDRSKRQIELSLGVKEIVRPGKPMEIQYTASKKSRIAVFAIDEGILQVAKYKNPDPLGHFLKKRSLEVETLQILDLILPEFNLVKELSASGGGEAMRSALAINLNPFARKVDAPAVYWSGIHDAGPDTQKVLFDVPDTFSGALRVIAVAVADESVGVTSEGTIVRGPFVISPNVLTQVAPGDTFSVTVGVANIIDGSGKQAPVDIEVKASEHLEIVGKANTQLIIDEGSEGKFTFEVKAKEVLGAADLTFIARYGEEDAKRTASLSVRPAMPYYTSFDSGFEKSGEVALPSTRDLYANLAEQSVSASASPLVLVDGLTSYLKNFPHGCTEQVVSKVFPLVGLMTHPAYAQHVPDVQTQFNHVIRKLRERQMSDGGFSFWPGGRNSAKYPSIYVMHFLIEARDLGYPVPSDMIDRGKSFLNDYAGRPAHSLSTARDRANAIYLLTRLGDVTTNYLVDLQEYLEKDHKKVWRKRLLASYMAATYHLMQKDNEARDLIGGYKIAGDSNKSDGDFHSALTQDAQHIYLLAKHFEDKAKSISGEDLLKLTNRIFKGEYNTISSAYTILALGAYSKLILENEFNENIKFTAINKADEKKILDAMLKPFLSADYSVDTKQVDLDGDKPLYYLNVQSGFDKKFPENAVRENIEIHRDFLDEEGNKITSFEQGKEVTVRLRVRGLSDKRLTNIAVIDLLPGGFEVIRSSVSHTAHNWRADYMDIREDRVVYYGSFDSTVRDLTYKVKLTSAGEFVIPPSYAESMYDRSIRSISESGQFTVTDAK